MGCCKSKDDDDDDEDGTGSLSAATGSTSTHVKKSKSAGSAMVKVLTLGRYGKEDPTTSSTAAEAWTVSEFARGRRGEEDEAAQAFARYTDPQVVFDALETKVEGLLPVRLLRLTYLTKGESNVGRVLSSRESLPGRAFIDSAELEDIYQKSGSGGKDKVLPIVAISCYWETPEHPDPQGSQLYLVVKSLKRQFREHFRKPQGDFRGFTDMGVFWDFASLYQGDRDKFASMRSSALKSGKSPSEASEQAWEACRNAEQRAAFEHAKEETMDLWYAHRLITVVLVNGNADVATGPEGDWPGGDEEEDVEEENPGDAPGDQPADAVNRNKSSLRVNLMIQTKQAKKAQKNALRNTRLTGLNSGWANYEINASQQVPKPKRIEALWPPVQDLGRASPLIGAGDPSGEPTGISTGSNTTHTTDSDAGAEAGRSSVRSTPGDVSPRRPADVSPRVAGSKSPRYSSKSPRLMPRSTRQVAREVDTSTPQGREYAKLMSPWPVTNADFEEEMKKKEFACANDRDVCVRLFKALNEAQLGGVEALEFEGASVPTNKECINCALCLSSCKKLKRLNFSHAHISGYNLELMCNVWEGIDDDWSERLDEKFKAVGFANLKSLNLSHNRRLKDFGVESISASFKAGKFPILRALNISDANVGHQGVKALVEASAGIGLLRELVLEGNKLRDHGVNEVAHGAMAFAFPLLEALNLARNRITDHGAMAIAHAGRERGFRRLRVLELHGNEIKDPGAMALGIVVGEGHLPRTIDLDANWISDAQVEALDEIGIDAGLQRNEPDMKEDKHKLQRRRPAEKKGEEAGAADAAVSFAEAVAAAEGAGVTTAAAADFALGSTDMAYPALGSAGVEDFTEEAAPAAAAPAADEEAKAPAEGGDDGG